MIILYEFLQGTGLLKFAFVLFVTTDVNTRQ